MMFSSTFWDHYAAKYDGLMSFYPYAHLVDHVSDIVVSYSPRLALDLGCGTGNVTAAIAQKDSSIRIDAVDWSAAMLRRMETKVSASNVRSTQSDLIQYLKCEGPEYDVIVLTNVVYAIADRASLWESIGKRLSPGGRIVVANPDTNSTATLVRDYLRNRSARSLINPTMLAVWLFDFAISLSGASRIYDFASREVLMAEIEHYGFEVDGTVTRCYGGHIDGIDLLFTLKKRPLSSV